MSAKLLMVTIIIANPQPITPIPASAQAMPDGPAGGQTTGREERIQYGTARVTTPGRSRMERMCRRTVIVPHLLSGGLLPGILPHGLRAAQRSGGGPPR